MSQKRILFVEDELAHQLIIKKALQGHYEYHVASSYQEALKYLNQHQYDLFLLDVMLGDGLGFDLVYSIRSHETHGGQPIMFLTSRDDISSKVKGFSLGADDYVTKPCDPRELRARIDSKIGKVGDAPVASEYRIGSLCFSFETQLAYVNFQEEETELDLTPIEYKLLYFFARHHDEALTREKILDQVWGQNTHVMIRSVDTYVAGVRKKLKSYGIQIKSVHGVGYRIQFAEDLKSAG